MSVNIPALRFKDEHGYDYSDWQKRTVQRLIDEGVIISHLDGNHGQLYPRAEEFSLDGVPYISGNDFVNGFVDFPNH